MKENQPSGQIEDLARFCIIVKSLSETPIFQSLPATEDEIKNWLAEDQEGKELLARAVRTIIGEFAPQIAENQSTED